MLLAGFDLGRSRLEEARIDHLEPTVAARDVVDRATLQAFVTAAGEYFIELMETGDLAAFWQASIAFRDPNGPWIHGPECVAVLQPDSKIILFHGGFPDRFELRRGGIATDPEAVTGELTSTVTSINPDVCWQSSDGMNLWAAAGYGTGPRPAFPPRRHAERRPGQGVGEWLAVTAGTSATEAMLTAEE